MKTSQRIYLPFKRLIGILGSFVGIIVCFVFLWWWVIPVNANNEEHLRECGGKYIPSAFGVKSGFSGYAQIKMKREHDPEFKAEWDSKYVERMSFCFDIGIFGYTISKIFGATEG